MEIVVGAATVLGVVIPVWLWVSGELTRVRTALQAAEPTLDCSIGSYSGASSGLHAAIHNTGPVRAHDLAIVIPTMGTVWRQAFLEKGGWARPQVPIPDDAAIRSTELSHPVVILTYKDRFEHAYTMTVPLTQSRRDDGRFNLGSLPNAKVERPVFGAVRLWKMRKQV